MLVEMLLCPRKGDEIYIKGAKAGFGPIPKIQVLG